jgi:alpha,alpha-trehalose phosphorylase
VIQHPAFAVEPWVVRETELSLDNLAQTESVFALSNGHIGLRGNLDEGEPNGMPGTYLNGFYEIRPLPYAEAGYGYPEAGQTILNVTNGKLIRLLVEDEPFDVRYGELRQHERLLDLRRGVLRRTVEWISPTGTGVRVSSTRVVSFSQRAAAAITYEVEPLEATIPVVIQSELIANEPLPKTSADPRAAAVLEAPLKSDYAGKDDLRVILAHSTTASGLSMAAAMDHLIDGPEGTQGTAETFEDLGRVQVSAVVSPGKPLRVVKFLAYGWSSQRSSPAIRDQVAAALAEAHHTGWDGLCEQQTAYLDDYWDRADIELDGDSEVQQAVRFALFHTLQAGARAEQRAIAAKGLTGPGYDGHTFWDTESFVLPVLIYSAPRAAADALRWRHSTLDLARERARQLGLNGAAFPWRTIRGQECSSYWPAGTAAFHINADIASAALRYVTVTGDQDFERDVGVELLVETARLWRSLGHHDSRGRFRIDGVTGPDEYSAIADNNVYTNLMAQRNLRAAADAVTRHMDVGMALSVDEEEAASWRDAADAMLIPFDARMKIHPQAEGFLEHQLWDFEATKPDQYPLLLHFPYFDLYRKQVVKQADLVLAMHVRGDAFTEDQKLRNFDYYERLTVRDSSLSACTQAVIAAEVGYLDLAYDYIGEAALMDLDDLEHNTRDGLHIASLAGAVSAILSGLGGVRDYGDTLRFMPHLPEEITRLKFHVARHGCRLSIELVHDRATYSLLEGDEIKITHHGKAVTVRSDKPQSRAIPKPPARKPPTQPAGRAPVRRRPGR